MNTKLPLALLATMSASTMFQQADARQRIVFNDPWWDTSWIDEAFEQQRLAMDEMRQHFQRQLPSKETQEAMKKARQSLANVKIDIAERDQKAIFTFTGFENLDKKDVEIEKKKWGWAGTIKTKDGVVEFVINARGIEIARHAEVKIKEKSPDTKDTKDATDAKEAKSAQSEQVFYSSSYTSESQSLKHPIDINSLKVDARTATSLTLSADEVKRETLQIP